MVTVAAALLSGCVGGLNLETTIDEVRVVAVVSEPPEVSTGETVGVQITVADPLGESPEAWLWTCPADPSSPCSEPSAVALVDEQGTVEVTVGDAEGAQSVWTLACVPGLCDPTSWSAADRLDPSDRLAELPVSGVSAARSSIVVSTRPEGERNANPVVVGGDEPIVVDTDGVALLSLEAVDDEDLEVFPYASAGGFERVRVPVIDGQVELGFVGSVDPAKGWIYVVVVDGAGGTALWRQSVIVRAAS